MEEETSIGFYIVKQEAFPIWMDFFWTTVQKAEAQKWESVSTLTQVYPGSGLTDDHAAAVIGASQTSIIYLTWDPVSSTYLAYVPDTGILRELSRDGDNLQSAYTLTQNGVTFTEQFTAVINDDETMITGTSVLSTEARGPAYEYHVVWTKLDT